MQRIAYGIWYNKIMDHINVWYNFKYLRCNPNAGLLDPMME